MLCFLAISPSKLRVVFYRPKLRVFRVYFAKFNSNITSIRDREKVYTYEKYCNSYCNIICNKFWNM